MTKEEMKNMEFAFEDLPFSIQALTIVENQINEDIERMKKESTKEDAGFGEKLETMLSLLAMGPALQQVKESIGVLNLVAKYDFSINKSADLLIELNKTYTGKEISEAILSDEEPSQFFMDVIVPAFNENVCAELDEPLLIRGVLSWVTTNMFTHDGSASAPDEDFRDIAKA